MTSRWDPDPRDRHDDRRPRMRDDDAGPRRRPTPMPSLSTLTARREPVAYRGETYALASEDVRLLRTVGTFRAIYTEHLRDDFPRLDRQTRHLRDQGLLEDTTTMRAPRHEPAHVLTLTPVARDLVRDSEDGAQRYYSGFVKPREIEHDAQLFRLCRQHGADLEARGAHVEQIRLDVELKQALWSRDLADLALADRADALGLPYDPTGRVQIPDLQLVIREPDGRVTRCNVELATRHYSAGTCRAKAAAGFTVYRQGTAPRGPDYNRDLAARFLAL